MDFAAALNFETLLEAERPRLVRLCAWLARSEEPAEDLAQETLIAAWKHKDQLTSLDKLKPWTSGIARNICLNWSRQYLREQAHSSLSIDSGDYPIEEEISAATDLELELDRHELANLLDRAMSLLPPDTRQMLIAHYLEESSHTEIAARMNVNPGTVAVRLQRGKLTLQKLFRKTLRKEAAGLGIIQPTAPTWEATNIWCPWCGAARLLGRYEENEVFALRCPSCDPDPRGLMAGFDLSKPYYARLLGNVKTYKPAYSRLLSALAPLYREAVQSHTTACLACGHAVDVSIEDMDTGSYKDETRQIRLHCPACDWTSNKALTGLLFSLPQVQQFWREHPRLRTLPVQKIERHGSLAFVRRLQSVTDQAELTVISRQDTFDPVEILTNVAL